MKQLEEQKIKRVLIEFDNGTTFYDGKPDLLAFIIENKDGEQLNCKGGNFVNNEVATSGMIAHTIDKLEKLTAKLALIGLLQMVKEEEASKEKTND